MNKKDQTVIKITDLWAGYDSEPVLENINLKVNHLDYIGLIGPNGGGKTTLMRALIGLIKPMKGSIKIMGESPVKGRCYIGYVPQQVAFDKEFPISVWDVVKMGRLGCGGILKKSSKEDDDIIAMSLEQVEILNLRDKEIGDLSVGQRQRVYIARALTTLPQILLLDEPTSSVDPQASHQIYELLNKINETITILMVSHNMEAVSAYVKSIGCINRNLFYHGSKEITTDMVDAIYKCPIDLIAHGVPHRVLAAHSNERKNND